MGNDGGWGDVEFTWLLELRIEIRESRRTRNKEQRTLTSTNSVQVAKGLVNVKSL
ncbi:MAG: hypothetical protein RI922_647 [Bacteroidota bacterium]|jgi:hypothetical protein